MENEIFIRLGIFFLAVAALALLEQAIPRRSEEANKGSRWRTNWSFIIIDSFFLRLLAFAIPLLAIGAAMDAKANSIGIFNLFDWPIFVEFILSILILDFAQLQLPRGCSCQLHKRYVPIALFLLQHY